MKPLVNGRFVHHRVDGMHRYATEILKHMNGAVELLAPAPISGPRGHLWEQTQLLRAARGRLLWSPCMSGPILHPKHIVTFHDLFAIEHPEWYSTTFAIWYRTMTSILAKRAVKIIAVSNYTKGKVCSLLGRDPRDIDVVHSGVGEEFRPAGENEIEAAISRLGLPSRRYVLSVSSLESRKNLARVLTAWEESLERLPQDCWLVLAGRAASRKVFGDQKPPKTPPRVFYPGYVPNEDLPALYSGAQFFIFASLAEGFGLPVLEAMACGTPCVVSNTTSLPEIGGRAAQYVDPLDIRGISEALVRNTKQMRSEPDAASLARSAEFSWKQAAARTEGILLSHA